MERHQTPRCEEAPVRIVLCLNFVLGQRSDMTTHTDGSTPLGLRMVAESSAWTDRTMCLLAPSRTPVRRNCDRSTAVFGNRDTSDCI